MLTLGTIYLGKVIMIFPFLVSNYSCVFVLYPFDSVLMGQKLMYAGGLMVNVIVLRIGHTTENVGENAPLA